jgi:phage anti-repressor protein
VEKRDFIVFTQKGENPVGGRPVTEYHLSIDSAKHVAMMCGTDKGFEARFYFSALLCYNLSTDMIQLSGQSCSIY